VALVLAVLITACQSVSTLATADLSSLQGYWQGHGPGGGCSVTIAGNALRFHARPDFWYETEFTLLPSTDPKQLHATIIKESSPEQAQLGTVVVVIFKIEGEKLTLGVVEDFAGPPPNAVVGDWDWVTDLYYLERVSPAETPAA
jgi:hypothetical protein